MISESEIDGESCDKALKGSILIIQYGVNNLEMSLMRLFENDTIDPLLWIGCNECSDRLLLLSQCVKIYKEFSETSNHLVKS